MENYSVNLRILSEYEKIETRKSSELGHFSDIGEKALIQSL